MPGVPNERSTAERVYRGTTRVFASVICVFGVAMIILTLARGGGPGAFGVWLGVAFTALGVGRIYIANRS